MQNGKGVQMDVRLHIPMGIHRFFWLWRAKDLDERDGKITIVEAQTLPENRARGIVVFFSDGYHGGWIRETPQTTRADKRGLCL